MSSRKDVRKSGGGSGVSRGGGGRWGPSARAALLRGRRQNFSYFLGCRKSHSWEKFRFPKKSPWLRQKNPGSGYEIGAADTLATPLGGGVKKKWTNADMEEGVKQKWTSPFGSKFKYLIYC